MEKNEKIKEIVELHRTVNRALRKTNQEAWMQLDLTGPQVKSLFFITDNGQTNFKSLASALKVAQSNLTAVIDRLVEHNLVVRNENPDDRRMIMLRATEKGEALVSDLRDRRIIHLSKALAELSTDELNTIANGLALLAKVTKAQSEG